MAMAGNSGADWHNVPTGPRSADLQVGLVMLHQSEVGEQRDGSGVSPGREITNMEPTPGSLVQLMLPPWATRIVRAIASPSPEPPTSRDRALSTRKNRSNTRGTASAGIPMPVSATSIVAVPPDCRVEIVTAPRACCRGWRWPRRCSTLHAVVRHRHARSTAGHSLKDVRCAPEPWAPATQPHPR